MILLAGCQFDYFNPPTEMNQATPNEESRTSENFHPQEPTEPELTLDASYFNEIIQVDGKNVIQNPDNLLILVNKVYTLSEEYEPEDLVRPNVAFSFGNQDVEKSYLRQEAAAAIEKMFEAAANDGFQLYAISGYRSYDRQEANYNEHVNRIGEEETIKIVAYPGRSEHQTGLAMDISSESANFRLNEQFGETDEGKWLMENAHKYGYILRYPKGMETITGYNYEPWHYRYVGVDIASEMYEHQLTLEEYFNIVKKI